MNTFALLTVSDHLKSPAPEAAGGFDSLNRRYVSQEAPQSLMAGPSGENGAMAGLKQTVGIRLACSSVVRWYHGGINE